MRSHNNKHQVKPLNASNPYYRSSNCKSFLRKHTVQGSGTSLNGNIPLNVFVPENTMDQPVFEDYTRNHNKTMIQLSSQPIGATPALPLTITIRTRGSDTPIVAMLQVNQDGSSGIPRVFQVEDFESLTVTNPDPLRIASLDVFIQKSFCIDCLDQKKNCYRCY